MKAAGIGALVAEVRSAVSTLSEDAVSVGPVAVSGMLAEQLAKELGAGALAGAVVVGSSELSGRAEVLVRIVAGDPTPEDEQLVDSADAHGVAVVMVQLWPQAEWTKPFVLTPFVVECRAGEGFPVGEIAKNIVTASEHGAALAGAVPALADAARSGALRGAVIRAALIGLAGRRLGVSRPLLTLEQLRTVAELRTISARETAQDDDRVRVAGAVGVAAAGFAFRRLARSLRTVVPAPVAQAAVAAAGTYVLTRAYELVDSRLENQ